MTRSKVIVIGAGIAGASIAAELAIDADVTLLEAEESAGYHTTGRSAAMYLPSYGNEVVRALTRASLDFLEAPPPGFAEHPLLRSRGLLMVADAEHAHMLDAPFLKHQLATTVDEALALVPALRRDSFVAASYDPVAADIDVDLLHKGYLRLAKERGAQTLLGKRIAEAKHTDGCWHIATADGTTLSADLIVNAAGAWGDEMATLFGAKPIGSMPLRRTMLLIDPPQGMATEAWPFTMTVEEGVYFRPEAGKLAISPADETPCDPGDVQPEELDIAIGIDRFQTIMDIPVTRVVHSWAGLRTFAPDRSPVIGHDPSAPGFFWFVGQGGYGIQMAPATAALGAALAMGKPVSQALLDEGVTVERLSPARFNQGSAA